MRGLVFSGNNVLHQVLVVIFPRPGKYRFGRYLGECGLVESQVFWMHPVASILVVDVLVVLGSSHSFRTSFRTLNAS
jgi:hypothetical protein